MDYSAASLKQAAHEINQFVRRQGRSVVMPLIDHHPFLYFPLIRVASPIIKAGRAAVVDPETQLVIEGFQGSGNTFALAAFMVANPAVRVAHHTHAPAQLLRAVRLGSPTLVVIRRPEDAILSFLSRAPSIGVAQTLRAYVKYYRTIERCCGSMVVVSFEQVTTDFGAVTELLNRRFGTAFSQFEHCEANVGLAFEWIEKWYRRGGWVERRLAAGRPAPDLTSKQPKPTNERAVIRARLTSCYRSPQLRVLREQAERAYASAAKSADAL